ncbi:MAG: phosphoglycerate mutase family protein [Candidatus Gastranaerophilales bacterium]|nr:phosphoglycerate mutase family protein [Candidatus Gastranaerophilales bacterium]
MIFNRKCKITFICHGATINTEENRFFDNEAFPPLNGTGRVEAEKIANWVNNKGLKIDNIYVSSALRTVQSARIISDICRRDFEIIDTLTSRKSGEWSGLSFKEIELKYPDMLKEYFQNSDNFIPQGAESSGEFNKRINQTINEIINKNINKRLIVVTHSDVIQAAVANALNIPDNSTFKVYIPTGSATQISYFEDFSSLVYSAFKPV